MPIRRNLILNTDSYKASHYLQYPPNTSRISCYIESRGGQYPQTLFFGLQMFLQESLCQPITRADIDEAEELLRAHGLPFNRAGWEYILNSHNGYLPLAIEAVPEGTVLPLHNVMLQIVNTDPQCFWLPTYIETALLRAVWYPTTVATYSWHCKAVIQRYLAQTADDLTGLNHKLHDFGARGVSSYESAAIGGAAHLVNFASSDTLAGIIAARRYYHEPMAARSIPAAEHSTIVTWGKEREAQAYQHLFNQFAHSDGAFSVVSDSYDIWHALDKIWGGKLQQTVVDNPGTLVLRPDSGDPTTMVTKTIDMLIAKFGSTINSKGYHVLPSNIRIIHGDSINITTIEQCLQTMQQKKQSAENITFGIGGSLLQKLDRDTEKFAMKANAVESTGHWHDVFKTPKTDLGKVSKPGRLALVYDTQHGYQTIRREQLANRENLLIPIFKEGQLLRNWNLQEIRARAQQSLTADSQLIPTTHSMAE